MGSAALRFSSHHKVYRLHRTAAVKVAEATAGETVAEAKEAETVAVDVICCVDLNTWQRTVGTRCFRVVRLSCTMNRMRSQKRRTGV